MNEEKMFEQPRDMIMDAANELMKFRFFPDFNMIKELIKARDVKTIEEYTHKTTAELEAIRPGITSAYNSLVARLRDPHLTREEFEKIMKDAYAITH